MFEKLTIAIVSFVLGIFLFKYREQYLTKIKRDNIKKRLRGKLLFWIFEEWGEEFENIFLVGYALSQKFDYLDNFQLLKENKTLLTEEIEKRLVEVKNSINENELSKSLTSLIPNMHEKQFELLVGKLNNYQSKIENGTLLLSKEEVGALKSSTQIYYLNLESHLIQLIDKVKQIFYYLRYTKKLESESINSDLIELSKLSVRTTMAIALLQKRI